MHLYVEAAAKQKMLAYGYSSHAPVPFPCKWCMKLDRLAEYVAGVRKIQEQWKEQIEIYCGLEVDYIPNIIGPSTDYIKEAGLDYHIGSIHFIDAFDDGTPWEIDGLHSIFKDGLQRIFKNDLQAALERYYALTREMVVEDCPDVVGHLDKIKIQNRSLFSEDADWYRKAVMQTLEEIAAKGVIMEVNTRGLYKKRVLETYPSRWILIEAKQMGIPIMLNSDSHHPREITGEFERAAEVIRSAGYKEVQVLLKQEWQPRPI